MKKFENFRSLTEAKETTVALKGADNISFEDKSGDVVITIADGSKSYQYTLEKGIDVRKVKEFFNKV